MTDSPAAEAVTPVLDGSGGDSLESLPVIVVPDGAMHSFERVAGQFLGHATVRAEDISTPEGMRTATIGADAVVVGLQRLSEPLIHAMDQSVRVIGRMGVGTDTVDLDAAAANGITVFNEPAISTHEVAAHAMALLLAVHRKLDISDRFVRRGWHGDFSLGPMKPLDELIVGVVGCGRIGRTVAQLVAPLVQSVLVYDPAVVEVPSVAVRVDRLDDMLTQCDLVTLHVPLTPDTYRLLGRRELSLLPRGAIVLNVSRGGQVDEAALADMLIAGDLGGAGLDVFETEPLPPESPITRAPNTVLTPHCASYSDRAAWRLGAWTVADAIEWLKTGSLRHGSIVVSGSR
jgi:D-3-phosphoglycerate dehydrogenase / 2-oxoglutarate reductase